MFNIFSKKIRFAIRSPRWQTIRKEHLKKQPRCQACGKRKDLEVHHIVPVHMNPEKELDPSNLITLCSNSCHIMFGHLMDFKSYNLKVKEDCAEWMNKITDRPYHT
jgi:5-methylcytosine-specific restriction endonuclease McrA